MEEAGATTDSSEEGMGYSYKVFAILPKDDPVPVPFG
jgi:hypothetical protein